MMAYLRGMPAMISPFGLHRFGRDAYRLLGYSFDGLGVKTNIDALLEEIAALPGTQQFVEAIRMQRRPLQEQAAIETINLIEDHPLVFQNALQSIEFDGRNGTTITIPDEFKGLLGAHGDGTGCGELLFCLLLKNVMRCCGPNALHDFSIEVDGRTLDIGMKDSSGLTSSKENAAPKRSRTTQPDADDPFIGSNVVLWLVGLGYDIKHFGVKDISTEEFELAVMERYGLSLLESVRAFERELQDAFRLCRVIGNGMVFIEWLDDPGGQRCLRYFDRDHLYFAGCDKMGIHISHEYGRFESSIMSRTRKIEDELARQLEKDRKAVLNAARRDWRNLMDGLDKHRIRAKRLVNLLLKGIEAEKKEKKKMETLRKAEERSQRIHEFAQVFKECGRIKEVARQLGIKPNRASYLKREAVRLGLLVGGEKRDAGRDRRRKHEARDQGSLGPNPSGVKRKRNGEVVRVERRSQDQGRDPHDPRVGHAGSVGEVPGATPPREREVGVGPEPDPRSVRAAG